MFDSLHDHGHTGIDLDNACFKVMYKKHYAWSTLHFTSKTEYNMDIGPYLYFVHMYHITESWLLGMQVQPQLLLGCSQSIILT